MITIENLFRQEVLKTIKDWDARAKLMKKDVLKAIKHG